MSGLGTRFVKFAGVGVIGTAGHYATLIALVDGLGVTAVPASSAGYIVGAIINYLLNYRFTFRSTQPHLTTAPKFFSIALIGFFLNGAAMAVLAGQWNLYYLLAQVLATGLVLIWNFAANQFWTFGRDIDQ